jgi:hypothetical protein
MSQLTEDDQVRVVLRLAVSPVESPSTLLPEVHCRIRRVTIRRRVRRLTATGGAFAVLAISFVVFHGFGASRQPATGLSASEQALLARPTGGDLAGNAAYRSNVLATWTAWVNGPAEVTYQDGSSGHLTAQRNVAWIGRTPVGPAAIAVQELQPPPTPTEQQGTPAGPGLYVTYLAADTNGAWAVVAGGTVGVERQTLGGVLLGPTYSVLLSLDIGQPMEYATGQASGASGQVTYQPVVYTNGAATIQLPAGAAPEQATLRLAAGSKAATESVYVGNQPARTRAGVPPPWYGIYQLTPGVRVPSRAELSARFSDALRTFPQTLGGATTPNLGRESSWYAYGRLPGGTEVLAGQYRQDDGVTRTYVVLLDRGRDPAVIYGGVATPKRVLPVAVRLPAGRGWVLVRPGARLNWWSTDPARLFGGAARDAALVPGSASLVVRVEPDGAAAKQVTLTS